MKRTKWIIGLSIAGVIALSGTAFALTNGSSAIKATPFSSNTASNAGNPTQGSNGYSSGYGMMGGQGSNGYGGGYGMMGGQGSSGNGSGYGMMGGQGSNGNSMMGNGNGSGYGMMGGQSSNNNGNSRSR